MMNKSKTSKAWRWKVATFLPLLALLLMAFGNRSETRIEKEIGSEMSSITQSGLNDDIRYTNQDVVSDQKVSDLVLKDQKKQEAGMSEVKQEQQKVIKGKVIDEFGNALEGVKVSGSKRMKTTTDANGNFEIEMTEDVPLWFSHAGLQSTVRTPPEFEESAIVKMETEVLHIGIVAVVSTGNSGKVRQGSIGETQYEHREVENINVLTIAEQMPEYPGGIDALRHFMMKNIKYPEIARNEKAQGEVFVNFVINREGRACNAKVIKPVHPSLDQEALRVIYSMSPWKPGVNLGEKVNVAFTARISFRYSEKTSN